VNRRAVLVVADDLGYDPAIDQGILEAHARGIVTAASALVDGSLAGAALAAAPDTLGLGLHLALPAGTREEEAGREIVRQLRLFEDIRGAPPVHVDGHKHVHAEPPVLAALLRVAGPLRLRVRALDAPMRDRIRASGARACDHFLGDASLRPCWTPARLLAAVSGLSGGTTEIMMHPGMRPTHVRTSFGVEREVELAAATDPRVNDALRTAAVELRCALPE
jgi:predicted glycoside hydrolase/deacetylase ChbG (UPF0249 family)